MKRAVTPSPCYEQWQSEVIIFDATSRANRGEEPLIREANGHSVTYTGNRSERPRSPDGSGVNREARTKPLSSSARHPKAVVAKAVALPVVSFSGGPLG